MKLLPSLLVSSLSLLPLSARSQEAAPPPYLPPNLSHFLRPGTSLADLFGTQKLIDPKTIQLLANRKGNYHLGAMVNGVGIVFTFDTGATYVTLSTADAAKVGIQDVSKLPTMKMMTACGLKVIHEFKAESVELGSCKLKNVDAAFADDLPHGFGLFGVSATNQTRVSIWKKQMTISCDVSP